MIIAEISTFPVDKGIHLHQYVKEAIRVLDESGLNYLVGPMGTCIEAPDTETLFEVMRKMHEAIIAKGSLRVVTTIKIDDRRDTERHMLDKVEAVKLD
ncbi:MAG TPA: MTH1187 family thiamine-binding protein [Thermoplasmata archaeon]|nr:MTH1187 family thiamine-binding protein [Thermoplasmata archaeon]